MNTAEVNEFATWSARDYVQLPPIPDHWRVADIGPGAHPLKRANVYIDHRREILEALPLEKHQRIMWGDLQEGLTSVRDNAFDFVWVAHVLEHCIELQKCVDTLNRIAKRGCAVMPSFVKESIFHFEDASHFWVVLPNPTHGEPPIFVEQNRGFIQRLRDEMCQQAASFLYRTGTQHDCTAEQYLRGWYQRSEPMLDIVAHWDEEHPLKVIAVR